MKRLIPLLLAAALQPAMASTTVIVNDTWADGGRTNGADPLDTGWFYSTTSAAIEVGPGFLGLVSGTSGRGIHGTFAPQTLNVGDSLKASFTFTTPATVGTSKADAFRVGLFNSDDSPGSLAADLTASSSNSNALYVPIKGYAAILDVNTAAPDISILERKTVNSGQLLATTADYVSLSAVGTGAYTFAANTSYAGTFTLTRTGVDSLSLSSALYQGASLLSSYSAIDLNGIVSGFDVLAFQVGSSAFGSSNAAPNNGIDFTNIRIEYTAAAPVPEPASVALLLAGLLVVGRCARRRSQG